MFEELPKGHFGAILADPPWRFKVWSSKGISRGADNHYATLTTRQISRLPVDEAAAPDCALFLWAAWPHLEHALKVIDAWGFVYKTCAFSWFKADPYRLFADEQTPFMGLGYWTRANTEPCLLATRGRPNRLQSDIRQGIIEPRREHSRKPDCVHDRIERLVGGPYLELFARQERAGWTTWGNEVEKYNPQDDINKSVTEGFRAIKERQAEGGPGWSPQ